MAVLVGEIRQPCSLPSWLSVPLTTLEMVPSAAIVDLAVIGGDGDGAAVALHGIAVGGDDLAVLVKAEMTVAGVAHRPAA